MRLKGHYYRLYTRQFRQELERKYNVYDVVAESTPEQATA